jgi:DNA polymerase-3 subunit alpha/error-prone DNA polymerase
VIHTSIVRPAANDYLREYLRRLHGRPWSPLHPLVAGVLEETYGLMVYQEQVSLVAKALAGFPPAEGEALRKVLTRKDRRRALQDFRDRFVAGAEARGVEPAVVEEAWRMIMSFSGYSFCKPHSASYARVSFQAAFLKAHFPAEFMAAVIDNQGGFYSTFAYVSEARRMGLEVLPPDVNRSDVAWRGEGKRLRVGLAAIKGLGRATMERVVSERVRNGPYQDLEDFLLRVWPREDEFWALVHAGALDSLHPGATHAEMFWRRENLRASRMVRRLLSAVPVAPPPLPRENEVERLRRQFRVLGFLVDRHPLELIRERMEADGLARAKDLLRMSEGGCACWHGWSRPRRSPPAAGSACGSSPSRTRPGWWRRWCSPSRTDVGDGPCGSAG